MKIKTKKITFAELNRLKPFEHKNPVKQSAFWRNVLKIASASELKQINLEITEENMDMIGKKEPCLFLMNHSSFTDLQIASTYLVGRQYHIICTNDGFVGKEWLLSHLGCIPAKKFITDITLVKDMVFTVNHHNSSILMFPEASYSFDGTETPLPDSLAKFVKLLNIPVVMIRTSGAFLRDPLYNCLQKRDVKVTTRISCLLMKEDIKEKSNKEINALLAEAFHYDHFKEQKENGVLIKEPFRADGLDRVLYKCRDCGSEEHMKGNGIFITCEKCGAKYELAENGDLIKDSDKSVTSIPEWYRWERECVREEIEKGEYKLDIDVDIKVYQDTKAIYEIGRGRLTQDNECFTLTGEDGLHYVQNNSHSYSLYSDYFWYEIGDMICIGDSNRQYYCFPLGDKKVNVAKARLATEELYKKSRKNG